MSQCLELGPDDEVTDLALHQMSTACYQQLMRDNLSHKLRTFRRQMSGVCLAVCSGGKVLGIVHFEQAGYRSSHTPGLARLLVDFAVHSRQYRHLSKLVLRAAISREARLLVERNHKHRVECVRTTAFSDHPQSMKYRGVFSLVSRETHPGGYKLVYEGRMTDMPLAEHLRLWLKEEANKRAQV